MSIQEQRSGKLTPMLSKMESSVLELKKKTGLISTGKQTPITKTMDFSVSMVKNKITWTKVNQISKTMKDMIEKFEDKLESAKQELETLSTTLEIKSQESGIEGKVDRLNAL